MDFYVRGFLFNMENFIGGENNNIICNEKIRLRIRRVWIVFLFWLVEFGDVVIDRLSLNCIFYIKLKIRNINV